MSDIVCLGEALIDFVALETGVGVGEASGFLKAPGGAPANVAAGVARLGGSAAFIGKVGDDPFGRFLRDTLAAEGVETAGMRFDGEARTGLAFVSLREGGERDFAFFRNPSADMRLLPEEIDRNLVSGAAVFHFGSITQIVEPAASATREALRLAREAGRLVSYDPNLRPALWPDLEMARRVIRETLRLADIVKVSEEELAFLTGQTDVEAGAAKLLKEDGNIGFLAVTLGERGCWFGTSNCVSGFAPGYVVETIDTTGAGDAFTACLLLGLSDHLRTQEVPQPANEVQVRHIVDRANAAGALATTRKGAIPALPTAAEVRALTETGRRDSQMSAT